MEKTEIINHALDFAKIQAGLRVMSAEEISSMVKAIAASLSGSSNTEADVPAGSGLMMDPKKCIREASIICAICGKSYKVLGKAHLATHNLTPKEYRAMCGYAKDQPLTAKALARARRKKMGEMRLWERRGKAKTE